MRRDRQLRCTNADRGIKVNGGDCRVQDNNCSDTHRGIEVTTTGSFIGGNTCSGNVTNDEIAANSVVGVIVLSPLSPVISGPSGGAGAGTANPWPNFSC